MRFTWELLVVLTFLAAGGCLVAAQIVLIGARRRRMEQRAQEGDRRARLAVELGAPLRLLATIQVSVTILATLAATLFGSRLVDYLARQGADAGWLVMRGRAVPLVLVVLAISGVALLSGEVLLRLLERRRGAAPGVSLDDIEHLLLNSASDGSIAPSEQLVASKALRLGERTVKEIMRPRIEIDALDVDTPPEEVIGAVAMAGFSRLPVHEGDLDHIIGFVYTKDLLRQQHMGWPIEIRKLVRPALLVPETLRLDKLLAEFRAHRTQMALVLDEFGGTEGLVTMEDVLEELVGEIHDEFRQQREQDIVRRDEKSWLVDARVGIESFLTEAGLDDLRSAVPRQCTSLGGLVTSQLDRIARLGDRLQWQRLQLEVVNMDGPRIGRILVTISDRPNA
jgi:putative hemolysin